MLEKMDAFFENRLAGYDKHMLTEIEGASEFYAETARLLPMAPQAQILDLGCGTGLELQFYFPHNPTAQITGIDLSGAMLDALAAKFPEQKLHLIQGSYFDVPLGEEVYDAAVSVESLHHFTQAEKIPLYAKLHRALKDGGYFILTDYFAPSEEEERLYRADYLQLKAREGCSDDGFYHYDTPLTVAHETQALRAAGFSRIDVLNRWGATCLLMACR